MLLSKRKKIIIKISIIFLVVSTIIMVPYLSLYKASYGSEFDNSIYSSDFFRDKSVMVVVPHEDDEINIAGSTIKNYINQGSEVKVVFTTNGDYLGLGELRINEAISAMNKLGVKTEDIIFLGYGDQWNYKDGHIYYGEDDKVLTSHIGKTATYGNDTVSDFRTQIDGKSSLYTRENFKKDLKDVILKHLPDVIFSVDFDSHIDHRATSLFFDEVMKEILQEYTEYNPNIYKGFAYNTAWNAKKDFYSINMKSTLIPDKNNIQNSNYELDMPNYNWDNRVRFLIPKEVLTYTKLSNPIYKALSEHNSQNAKNFAEQIINSDQVFFERNSNSITYNSKVEVSSGNGNYINDFKLVDSSYISSSKNVIFDKSAWIPNKDDSKKSVKIIFDTKKDIESISLYDNFSLSDNIIKGKLIFSDGSEIDVENLNKNGSETVVGFEKKYDISFVEFKVIEYEGENPGLCELEVYEEKKDLSPKFIKLVVDDSEETFMYRYTVLDEFEIPIKVYKYPNKGELDDVSNYNIIIKGNSEENFYIENGVLKLSNRIKNGSYKIRIELKDNKDIFDEVEIIIPNKFQKFYLKNISKVEEEFIRIKDLISIKMKKVSEKLSL